MSANQDGEEPPPQNIVDDEGDVDKAIKRRIINARERVDETELALYRDAAIDPEVQLSEVEKTHTYGTTVRQFLRRIEPLLRTDKIDNNERYYEEEPIGEITLAPPDVGEYRFSAIQTREAANDTELRQAIGLPRGADIPEPVPKTFNGLKSVIEADTILGHQWQVCVERSGARPNWEFVYPTSQQAVPKRVYEEAMRVADMFLQDINLGIDLELPAYTGDDGPGL